MGYLIRWTSGVLAVGMIVLPGCGGGQKPATPTTDGTATGTASATVAAAPTPVPVIGVTDPEGDALVPEADIVSTEGYVDGKVLMIVIHLARLSADPGPAQISWGVSVWPDGMRADVAPPFSLNTRFAWPISDATVSAFGSDTAATRRAAAVWDAKVSVAAAAKTLRLTARIPGLTERAIVSPGTSHRVNATAASTAERVGQFAVTKRTMSVDPALLAPIVTKLLDDLREVSVAGFPLPLVIPMIWQVQSLGTLKTL